ncbi:hypothetical protein FRC18_010522 [Serendipita sp. 400]|nr:hypothetical protein FRC18_010522 [Serendipita sp. 400]
MHKFATEIASESEDTHLEDDIDSQDLVATMRPPHGVVIDDTTSTLHTLFSILDICRNTLNPPTAEGMAINRSGRTEDIFERMALQIEVRTECSQCKGVSYKLEQMDTIRGNAGGLKMEGADVAAATFWTIDAWATVEEKRFNCPGCEKKTKSNVRRRFARFPPILIVEKIGEDVPSASWNEIRGLDLEGLRGRGLQEGEIELPEPSPVTPVRSRPEFGALSTQKKDKLGVGWVSQKDTFPTSPTKGVSPTRRRRADSGGFGRLRQTTPSPTRRRRQLEKQIPSPVKRAKELIDEEFEEEKASELDIAAICALGFDRDMAIEALAETDGDVKKAVATLLAWENEESEEEEEEEEEEESEEEEWEEEEYESDTASSLKALRERYGISEVEEQTSSMMGWPAEKESGKYVLKSIIGQDNGGIWVVIKRKGVWISRNGVMSQCVESRGLEGVRLELWERL